MPDWFLSVAESSADWLHESKTPLTSLPITHTRQRRASIHFKLAHLLFMELISPATALGHSTPVFARSFFLAESDPAVLLSCQIFLHAQQIALADTLNNPQQLSHRGDLLQLLLNKPLKEIVSRI